MYPSQESLKEEMISQRDIVEVNHVKPSEDIYLQAKEKDPQKKPTLLGHMTLNF